MVVDLLGTHGLIVSSGNKAGLTLISLPLESCSKEGRVLSTGWVLKNWEIWIYPECNIENVYIIEQYEATPIG